MSMPVTCAPVRASGRAVVPSPQPRSRAVQRRREAECVDERFTGLAHKGGDLGKVSLFPERFVRIHRVLSDGVEWHGFTSRRMRRSDFCRAP